jgi:hypothetical protein
MTFEEIWAYLNEHAPILGLIPPELSAAAAIPAPAPVPHWSKGGTRRGEHRKLVRDSLQRWRLRAYRKDFSGCIFGPEVILSDKLVTRFVDERGLTSIERLRCHPTIKDWAYLETYGNDLITYIQRIDDSERERVAAEKRQAEEEREERKKRRKLEKEAAKRDKDEAKRREREEAKRREDEVNAAKVAEIRRKMAPIEQRERERRERERTRAWTAEPAHPRLAPHLNFSSSQVPAEAFAPEPVPASPVTMRSRAQEELLLFERTIAESRRLHPQAIQQGPAFGEGTSRHAQSMGMSTPMSSGMPPRQGAMWAAHDQRLEDTLSHAHTASYSRSLAYAHTVPANPFRYPAYQPPVASSSATPHLMPHPLPPPHPPPHPPLHPGPATRPSHPLPLVQALPTTQHAPASQPYAPPNPGPRWSFSYGY